MVILSDFLTPFPRQHILRNFLPFPPLNFRPLLWTAPDIEKYKKQESRLMVIFLKKIVNQTQLQCHIYFSYFLIQFLFF